MKKMTIIFLAIVIFIIISLAILAYFFIGKAPVHQSVLWGVDFSQMQAEALKLNWKENYLAILNDLGAKNIKLHTQWDFVEGKKGEYFFDDIDWQIKKAQEQNVKVIFVTGLKTGRWPECHSPEWLAGLTKEQQQAKLLEYIKTVVLRYKNSPSIIAWQTENEPFFKFGVCPEWYYESDNFLEKEVALVKSLDSTRPVIITDSGEQSLWSKAAGVGDKVGITMYRKVWGKITDKSGLYIDSFLPSINYYRKAQLIKSIYGKDVICIELQAEPWAQKPFYNVSLEEQEKTMNLEQFKKNIEFAKNTGLKEFYLWGAEWWYWLKTTQNKPEIWNEAKNLFK